MKYRWGICLASITILAITVFGMYEKRTYTDVSQDLSYLDDIHVAQLPENLCLSEAEYMSISLPAVPIIIRASALDNVEHIGGTSRQLVKVEEIYKGVDIKAEQDVYIISYQAIDLH